MEAPTDRYKSWKKRRAGKLREARDKKGKERKRNILKKQENAERNKE